MDRKYVVDADRVADLVDELAGRLAVLEIDGRRSSAYESVYFDTVDHESYRGAARRRRYRFKVRTRTYLDTETTMLEVKTKGRRGHTVKRRRRHRFERRGVLDARGRRFVDETTGVDELGSRLVPMLTTRYHRCTLVDLGDVARVTIDADLECRDATDRSIALRDRFVIETKSVGSPSASDRWLWSHGLRPDKISKFGTGLAALHPELPSNKWHRTLDRHFRSSDELGQDIDEPTLTAVP